MDYDLPEWIIKQLVRWASRAQAPDSMYLRHALENDYVATCRITGTNAFHGEVARFLFCEMPEESWGSRERISNWHGLSELDNHKAKAFEDRWLKKTPQEAAQ